MSPLNVDEPQLNVNQKKFDSHWWVIEFVLKMNIKKPIWESEVIEHTKGWRTFFLNYFHWTTFTLSVITVVDETFNHVNFKLLVAFHD